MRDTFTIGFPRHGSDTRFQRVHTLFHDRGIGFEATIRP
jgi:hypothetical protein